MLFEEALHAMRNGKRVKRLGWSGFQWVTQGAGQVDVPADKFWNKHTRAHAEANGGSASVLPYFILKNASGAIQMGWAPTQEDMIAPDWVELQDSPIADQ